MAYGDDVIRVTVVPHKLSDRSVVYDVHFGPVTIFHCPSQADAEYLANGLCGLINTYTNEEAQR